MIKVPDYELLAKHFHPELIRIIKEDWSSDSGECLLKMVMEHSKNFRRVRDNKQLPESYTNAVDVIASYRNNTI